MSSTPGSFRRIGERLGVLYPADHPLRRDRSARSRAFGLRMLGFYVSAAVLFWVVYGVKHQPAAFAAAAVLTFFAVMKARGLTKPRD
ncbi:hypothetical protein acdb102_11870 [Acidothermaceae bacterium B102]|nr:hypothetical protein acdb102_11870 [Acidothermaceae bacterium B102]